MLPIALGVIGFAAVLGVPALFMTLAAGASLAWGWVALAALIGALTGYLVFGRHLIDYYPGGKATRSSGSWTRFLPLITAVTPVVAIVTSRANPHATAIVGAVLCAWGAGFVLGIFPVWMWPEMARRRPGANRE